MILVVDTHVVVSALLNPRGAPGRVLDLVLGRALDLAVDDRILAEYRAVLTRARFGFDAADVEALMAFLIATAITALGRPLSTRLPDEDDEAFLEVAIKARADALVTGNLRHYPVADRAGVHVMSPAEFIAQMRAGPTRDRQT